MSQKAYVNVSVANLWSKPERDPLYKSVTSDVDHMDEWIKNMTKEEKARLHDKSIVQSQVLFGDAVLVEKQEGKWAYITVPHQSSSKNKSGYPGWIPLSQLSFQSLQESETKAIVTEKKTELWIGRKKKEIVFLTELPVVKQEKGIVFVDTPLGEGIVRKESVTIVSKGETLLKRSGEEIYETGKQFMGLPYLWGGFSPYGYDCSGFSYSMAKANGYIIPRDASDQAKFGESVTLENALPGDLLFFAYEEGKGKLHHVAIYAGNGRMLHSKTINAEVEEIEIKGTVYEKELCGIQRVWKKTSA